MGFTLLGPLALAHGPLVPVYFVAQLGNGGEGARGRRRTEAPPARTVAARRSFARIELQSTVSKSEGMGRERRVTGFRSGDSGHGRGAGRWSTPSSQGHGHGSSWGALLEQGGGRARLGACTGGYGGAHRRRNWTEMA